MGLLPSAKSRVATAGKVWLGFVADKYVTPDNFDDGVFDNRTALRKEIQGWRAWFSALWVTVQVSGSAQRGAGRNQSSAQMRGRAAHTILKLKRGAPG